MVRCASNAAGTRGTGDLHCLSANSFQNEPANAPTRARVPGLSRSQFTGPQMQPRTSRASKLGDSSSSKSVPSTAGLAFVRNRPVMATKGRYDYRVPRVTSNAKRNAGMRFPG